MNELLNYREFIESAIALLGIIVVRIIVYRLVLRRFNKAGFHYDRRKLIRRIMDFFALFLILVSLVGIWRVNGSQILTYLASVFTVLGVALFAQWSLLSNITAGIILYFNHPMKFGDTVSILDKDNPIVGKVDDITYFFIHIRDEKGEVYILSNTEMIQKMTIVKEL